MTDAPELAAARSLPELEMAWSPRPKFQDRRWLHVLLLLLTIASTMFWGSLHYEAFAADFTDSGAGPIDLSFVAHGLWYSLTILGILGCHELGHYLACRYYNVDASLPFFIPMPILMTGTMGAFIRIREPIPSKRMLFDIGIAGPIAGFVVAVPALIAGLAMSHMTRIPADFTGMSLGEPLLFKAVAFLIWGQAPDGYSINMHPMAFGAWWGLFATAINLLPIGQFDGGHISYAVFGRRSLQITLVTLGTAALLIFLSTAWILWTVVTIAILVKFGFHHPPTFDEHEPLDPMRMRLAVVALVIFVICFMPVPISSLDVITR